MFVRYINLNRQTQLNEQMKKVKCKFPLERFEAIEFQGDPETVLTTHAWSLYQKPREAHESFIGKGSLGCALSHIEVWKQFLESPHEHALVLEDDIDTQEIDIDSILKEKWDIALLGWAGNRIQIQDGHVIPWPQSKGYFGGHAYTLTRRAAEILLREAFPLSIQIDFYIQMIASKYKLKIRASTNPIRQKIKGFFQSDLQEFNWKIWISDIEKSCSSIFKSAIFLTIVFSLFFTLSFLVEKITILKK